MLSLPFQALLLLMLFSCATTLSFYVRRPGAVAARAAMAHRRLEHTVMLSSAFADDSEASFADDNKASFADNDEASFGDNDNEATIVTIDSLQTFSVATQGGVATSSGDELCVLVGCLDNSLAAKKRLRQARLGRKTYEGEDDEEEVGNVDIITGNTVKDGPPVPSRSGTSYYTVGDFTLEESLDELASLCTTAGLKPVGRVTQLISDVQPRTYIGRGKIQEVLLLMEELQKGEGQVCTVVFDVDLSPRQMKYLTLDFNKGRGGTGEGGEGEEEKRLRGGGDAPVIKVIDRTLLILDIFVGSRRVL